MAGPVPGSLSVRPPDLVDSGHASNEVENRRTVQELEEIKNPVPWRVRQDVGMHDGLKA